MSIDWIRCGYELPELNNNIAEHDGMCSDLVLFYAIGDVFVGRLEMNHEGDDKIWVQQKDIYIDEAKVYEKAIQHHESAVSHWARINRPGEHL